MTVASEEFRFPDSRFLLRRATGIISDRRYPIVDAPPAVFSALSDPSLFRCIVKVEEERRARFESTVIGPRRVAAGDEVKEQEDAWAPVAYLTQIKQERGLEREREREIKLCDDTHAPYTYT